MGEFTGKMLPVGVDSFEKIRSQGLYYVDKTAMIRDLLCNRGEVNLFTRPRRFGKSLNMSMLKSFFEMGSDSSLFDGLEITKEKELCEEYMGRSPVISVSLKGVNGIDYRSARSMLCSVVGWEAMRFQFLLQSDRLTDREKALYEQLVHVDRSGQDQFSMSDATLIGSLQILSGLLEKHYGKKVIILIDEYDVPLAKASERGYYDGMVVLIRNLFEQALKTNDSLHFAVLTGCLRVAKESIFTGLNNLTVFSITNMRLDEYFGFTDREVREMLSCYGLDDRCEDVRNWYDGYLFGETEVYCPWDVIRYCADAVGGRKREPENYWSNTSGNDVIRHFIEKMGNGVTRREMETLVEGETVEKVIHEDLTYHNIYDSVENLWSVLFMTGYLTQRGEPAGGQYRLAIPNMEIRSIFTEQIMAMFREDVARDGDLLRNFCEAIRQGDAPGVERLFTAYLKKTISIRDTFVRRPTKENFYHGILMGILGYKYNWYLKSNREVGDGYSDIFIYMEDEDTGAVIEVKYAQDRDLETACREALLQIDQNGYVEELRDEGCHTILKYGIACYKKTCRVAVEKEIL